MIFQNRVERLVGVLSEMQALAIKNAPVYFRSIEYQVKDARDQRRETYVSAITPPPAPGPFPPKGPEGGGRASW
jgi:hypothetical protein